MELWTILINVHNVHRLLIIYKKVLGEIYLVIHLVTGLLNNHLSMVYFIVFALDYVLLVALPSSLLDISVVINWYWNWSNIWLYHHLDLYPVRPECLVGLTCPETFLPFLLVGPDYRTWTSLTFNIIDLECLPLCRNWG